VKAEWIYSRAGSLLTLVLGILTASGSAVAASNGLQFSVNPKTGSYAIGTGRELSPVLTASAAVRVNGQWLHAADFPKRAVTRSEITGSLGKADEWTITYSGLKDAPELICEVSIYRDAPFGEIQSVARNTTTKTIHIEAFRLIDANDKSIQDSPTHGGQIIDLAGPAIEDRVLSDSFSENMSAITDLDLVDAEEQMHHAVGAQLVYNRQSHLSWFVGALTSNRFLSVMRLHTIGVAGDTHIGSYQVDSEGTTEWMAANVLRDSPPADRITLSLPVEAGQELASERLIFSVSDDYHKQLETYGNIIREIHHARVTAPAALGWWSWTAYYSGLNEGAALTNAEYLAQNLKPFGYNFFHIDEGYQFARGEYGTPDAGLFPHGMAALENKVIALGLVPGIWTAPFQVSERSWVYEMHPEWLVHNANGVPIRAGLGANETDRLFVLDTTNPGAQEYLRKTYAKLVNDWSIHYIKLDFMDDAAIEGYYFRPNTTALEAQRIGLKIIRDTVGENVLLDKDGSPMLNPVGYVDMGRISEDTGHTFAATKEVATGVAARYYMNRNFFVSDPDAFTVSKQTIPDGEWHESTIPLTLDEAKTSIALSAVSGGMFEIGDDLPTLGASPERLALVKNRDFLDMAQLGRASTPVDLMTYEPEDLQSSIFLLKEDARQTILTIFNWTEKARTHKFAISTFGFESTGYYVVSDVLDGGDALPVVRGTIEITQPAHSVRVLKIIDTNVVARLPVPKIEHVSRAAAGTPLTFSAKSEDAIVRYQWDFGDGVALEGKTVTHTYTHAGDFTVRLLATGLGDLVGNQSFPLSITGRIPTKFVPKKKRRYETNER
jgi:alpha-galactosidase